MTPVAATDPAEARKRRKEIIQSQRTENETTPWRKTILQSQKIKARLEKSGYFLTLTTKGDTLCGFVTLSWPIFDFKSKLERAFIF